MQIAKKEYLEIVEAERAFKEEADAAKALSFSDKDKDEGSDEEEEKKIGIEEEYEPEFGILPDKNNRSSSEMFKSSDNLVDKLEDYKQSLRITEEKGDSMFVKFPKAQILTEEEEAIMDQKKRLLTTSDKPWERVNIDHMGSCQKMFKRYLILGYKMMVTY